MQMCIWMGRTENDKFCIHFEVKLFMSFEASLSAASELRKNVRVHASFESFFKYFFKIARLGILVVSATHRVDLLRILSDVSPMVIRCIFSSRHRHRYGIASSKFKEASVRCQIAHQQLERTTWRFEFDIPISDTTVDLDVAKHGFSTARCACIFDF